jgi:nucleotide-binding universal stress UspA family protein
MMTEIRRILATTDFSPASDRPLEAAAALAAHCGAVLHLVHVVDAAAGGPAELGVPTPFRIAHEHRVVDAGRAAAEQTARLRLPVPVTVSVAVGPPAREILRCARQAGADLIVLGPHRARRLGDRLLGSTAERVVRGAHVPCLVATAPLRLPVRSVVAPVDLAEPAFRAVRCAMDWAAAFGAPADVTGLPTTDVRVLHVVPALRSGAVRLRSAHIDPDAGLAGSDPALAAPRADDVELRQQVLWGDDPAEAITRYAQDERADLIVLGTHGRSMLGRAVLGSTAAQVLRRADCPVLLVPPALWLDARRRGLLRSAAAMML